MNISPKIKNILWIVFAIAIVAVCLVMFILNPGPEHIEDTNGADNYSLQTITEQGVVQIDKYMDATEITDESVYHLILIYAPNAEGLMNTAYSCCTVNGDDKATIPIRLLNEPCCHSALLELKSVMRRISDVLSGNETEVMVNV